MRRALAIALLVLSALPAVATGHSLVRPSGQVVSYLSQDATSLNDLTVQLADGRIEFRDPAVDGGVDPGTCTPGDIDQNALIIQVCCQHGGDQRYRNALVYRLDDV